MTALLDRCVLEIDGRPVGVLMPEGDDVIFTATDPEADLLTGTRHSSPKEALSVVRAHLGTAPPAPPLRSARSGALHAGTAA
ncbi:hypothetical protein [Caenispirillum salinarum]|uniref:hypothetical protein n=1 Tax=Caenispirillum salinarum TaxID=859058 RepID=UPI00384BA96C